MRCLIGRMKFGSGRVGRKGAISDTGFKPNRNVPLHVPTPELAVTPRRRWPRTPGVMCVRCKVRGRPQRQIASRNADRTRRSAARVTRWETETCRRPASDGRRTRRRCRSLPIEASPLAQARSSASMNEWMFWISQERVPDITAVEKAPLRKIQLGIAPRRKDAEVRNSAVLRLERSGRESRPLVPAHAGVGVCRMSRAVIPAGVTRRRR